MVVLRGCGPTGGQDHVSEWRTHIAYMRRACCGQKERLKPATAPTGASALSATDRWARHSHVGASNMASTKTRQEPANYVSWRQPINLNVGGRGARASTVTTERYGGARVATFGVARLPILTAPCQGRPRPPQVAGKRLEFSANYTAYTGQWIEARHGSYGTMWWHAGSVM